MRIFVTGATGWVGSVVVQDLLAHGYSVLGLARSDAAALALEAAGVAVHRGSLEEPASLAAGAAAADGVIHTAFSHDFSKFAENGAHERRAIEAMGEVLAGSTKPLVVTSGVALIRPGAVVTESDKRVPVEGFPRDPETITAALVARGVRASVVRLPPSVHGHGEHGFVPRLIAAAREKGVSATIGEGRNRWSAVHRLDAAPVYRLALEKAEAGATYHAIGDEGVPVHEIAAVIGRRLGVKVASITPDQAPDQFGWFAMFAGIDAPASGERTRAALGWAPVQPGLLADLDHPAYFAGV